MNSPGELYRATNSSSRACISTIAIFMFGKFCPMPRSKFCFQLNLVEPRSEKDCMCLLLVCILIYYNNENSNWCKVQPYSKSSIPYSCNSVGSTKLLLHPTLKLVEYAFLPTNGLNFCGRVNVDYQLANHQTV